MRRRRCCFLSRFVYLFLPNFETAYIQCHRYMQNKILYLGLALLLSIASCTSANRQVADIIFYNGTILTMDEQEREVAALSVRGDSILMTGDRRKVWRTRGEKTEMYDLRGQTVLPGFIDGHSHFAIGMKMLRQADLSGPPVGGVTSINGLLGELSAYRDRLKIPEGNWILGWGYDPDQLEEGRHPLASELDAAFPDHPVLILHVSFHMCVVNSRAMELAGIGPTTPDPPGGVIVRLPGSGQPSGLLQEAAMYSALGLLPQPGMEQMWKMLDETQLFYAERGITTAQDGLTDLQTYEFLKEAAKTDRLFIDIECLASYRQAEQYLANHRFGESVNGLRLAGLKMVTDGSPQGKTAFFRRPYRTAVPGCVHDCRGFPTISGPQLKGLLTACYANDVQVYAHANGDAAIDLLLAAHEEVADSLGLSEANQRTVVIHSQFVRPDQLEAYRRFGFVPSFFTNHAFFWGDVHRLNLGEDRAAFLSPMQTARQMGITATNHTDFVITPLDQMFLLWSAVTRTTRSGKVLGPEERLTPHQGLQAITVNAAYQHRLEDRKGTLVAGKLADLVILDRNPLVVAPDSIKSIRVVRTIKGGKTIYSKE